MRTIIKSLILILVLTSCTSDLKHQRVLNFNNDWKFTLENVIDPYALNFDDSEWRNLDLPHDWSVEFDYDSVNGEGCTAYLQGGLGWYRKSFELDLKSDENGYILFDGVYNHAEVWLNGIKLDEHHYGYSPFFFELTPYLNNKGTANTITVKVDHTRFADSRWYSGSGIYRNVKLIKTNKLHIPIWGTFITTPEIREDYALVNLQIKIENDTEEVKRFKVSTDILNQNDIVVATLSSSYMLSQGIKNIEQNIRVDAPECWSIDQPTLYTAVSKIIEKGKVIDQVETKFGIRSIRFDAKEGFFLNGENMKIKGVCLHHDAGLVGAAVPKDVWKRRLQKLKDGGCNAIRIAHNPASNEFLDLCDEMGFLVQDEFFDEWNYPKDKRLNTYDRHDDYITRGYADIFNEMAETDLKNTMLSHRNHPSVFQWSIGNEIEWTYPRNSKATGFFDNMDWTGNYFWSQPPFGPEKIKSEYESMPALEHQIGTTANKLATWTREMDVTRPVIANCILPSASFQTGYADALDVVGFSYRQVMYDYAREYFPNKVVMGTESLPQWHEWKAVIERPFVAGTFLWTGIDYMGEANQGWPKKGTASGLLDLAGFDKQAWHMYKTLWSEEEHLSIFTQTANHSIYKKERGKVVEKKKGAWEQALWFWHDTNKHWNYSEGEEVIVEVISSCDRVELYLNGTSLGIKNLVDFPDRIYKWAVPFEAGELKAVSKSANCNIELTLKTAGEPTGVKLIADKELLKRNSDDVCHVEAQLIDAKGIPVYNKDLTLKFSVSGNVKILGVDNGNIRNVDPYLSNVVKTHNGRALLIVQENNKIAKSQITATAKGISSNILHLSVK